MRLRTRLAVDGGPPARHPHAYGTALDNDLCRSEVHSDGGWRKAIAVRRLFVPRVYSLDLSFSPHFILLLTLQLLMSIATIVYSCDGPLCRFQSCLRYHSIG